MTPQLDSGLNVGRDDENGFTLLEMVIAVVILVLITGAISAAFVSSMNASQSTKHRVSASQDAQLISGFFTRDAQAAGGSNPATGQPDKGLGVISGSFANCAAPGNSLVGFKWIDRRSGTTYVSNYSYVSAPAGGYQAQQFLRTICGTTSAVPPVTTTGTSVLANNVVTTTTGTYSPPIAWCDGNQSPPTCPAPPNTPSFPNTVSISMTILNTTANATSPYPFSLTANVRPQSDSVADVGTPHLGSPLMLLGGTGCPNGSTLTGGGNAVLTVYGIGAINGCPGAANLQGSSKAGSTDGTYVADPATCSGGSGNPIDPQCQQASQQFLDPFAPLIANGTLTPPSTAGCTGGSNPGPVSSGHYGPNTYPSLLTVNGVTFDPGTYVFCKGLNFSGDVTGNNVTFYFAGGTITGANNSSITLTKPTSGSYAPYSLTVWQVQGDSDPLTTCCANNPGTFTNILGTVYAPSAWVSFKNATVHVDQLIAVGMDLSPGTGGTTIGYNAVVTSTNPSSRGQGATNQNITINGGNFVDGPSLASSFGAGITVNSTTFVDSSHLTANITVAGNATVGPRDVTVTNGNGRVSTGVGIFSVTAGPGVTSANPSTMGRGLSNQNVIITGSGFVNGAGLTASFSGTGITVNSTTFNSATQVTANITTSPTATISSRNVTVTNPDGGQATANNAFAVIAPKIVSVTLGNGPNPNAAGTIEKNDIISIVFSSQMHESDICSTWTTDTANQSSSVNGNLVTVTDGGVGNDSITVTATSCTFGIGTIDLGSPLFVGGGSATFGTNGNRSTFSWNATTNTLTITLGAKTGSGTLVNVPGNVAPVYTASPIHDSGGAALTNSPFSLPSGKQF